MGQRSAFTPISLKMQNQPDDSFRSVQMPNYPNPGGGTRLLTSNALHLGKIFIRVDIKITYTDIFFMRSISFPFFLRTVTVLYK